MKSIRNTNSHVRKVRYNYSAPVSGAAYLFVRDGWSWRQEAYLKASNTDGGDNFGHSLAIFGSSLVIGARTEDSSASGVDGDQSDNSAPDAGAAYIFDLDVLAASCQWYCATGVNAATDGYVVTSPAIISGTFDATVTGCDLGNTGALLAAYSTPLSFLTVYGEILVNIADPNGELLGMPKALGNPATFSLAVPNDYTLSGFVFYTQAASFGGSICLHCAHECTVGY